MKNATLCCIGSINKLFLIKEVEFLNHYITLCIEKEATTADLHYKVFEYMYDILNIYNSDHNKIESKSANESEYKLNLFTYFWDVNDPKTDLSKCKGTELYYQLELRNTWRTNLPCPICEKIHKDSWILPISQSWSIAALKDYLGTYPLYFNIVWAEKCLISLDHIIKPHSLVMDLSDCNVVDQSSNNYTLYECLRAFGAMEKLDGDNKYNCNRWKRPQVAFMETTIYSLPKYLIIHLKRFGKDLYSRSVYHSKITDMVEYPVEGLDLTEFLDASQAKQNAVYDLYGIINHWGNVSGGHYTATCKNPLNKQWYEFNDADVKPARETQLVSNSAYVLFYKRRELEEPMDVDYSNGLYGYEESKNHVYEV